MDDGIEGGELVRVVTFNREFIAIGYYQIGPIAVRVLSFGDITIGQEFWESRLKATLNMRIAIGIANNPTNNTYRLMYGEDDLLPGLIIDCYGKTAVMQAHSVDMYVERLPICEVLRSVMSSRIEHVLYKSETTLPFKTELGQQDGFPYGGSDDNVAIENGLRFYMDWLKGQKTGLFVDQCENRTLLEKYAKNRSVFNMLCYTGGFSVYAMHGGVKLVRLVDSNAKAVELTNANIKLNFPPDAKHAAFCDDALKYLDTHDAQYDLAVLDPPAFAKHRAALRNALRGYARLNVEGFERIKPGGILFTFSCSQVVVKESFRNAVFTATARAKRKVRILH